MRPEPGARRWTTSSPRDPRHAAARSCRRRPGGRSPRPRRRAGARAAPGVRLRPLRGHRPAGASTTRRPDASTRSPSATTCSSAARSAVLVMVEAVARLLPGVLGNPASAEQDSFSDGPARRAGLHPAGGLARAAPCPRCCVGQPRRDRPLAPRPRSSAPRPGGLTCWPRCPRRRSTRRPSAARAAAGAGRRPGFTGAWPSGTMDGLPPRTARARPARPLSRRHRAPSTTAITTRKRPP